MIPGLVAILALILESPRFGDYQQLVIVGSVVGVFGVIGGVIAYGTVRHWKDSYVSAIIPQSELSLDFAFFSSPVDRSRDLGGDRWEEPLRLLRAWDLRFLFSSLPAAVSEIRVRTDGKFYERAKFSWGLVFDGGFPVINSHIERVVMHPAAEYTSKDADGFKSRAIFEANHFINGDYEMFSSPIIKKSAWMTWSAIRRAKKEKDARGDDTRVDTIGVAAATAWKLFEPEFRRQGLIQAPAAPKEHEDAGATEAVKASDSAEAQAPALHTVVVRAPEAYCLKCKQKTLIKDPVKVVTASGRDAVTGKCPVCGTKLFKIGGKATR